MAEGKNKILVYKDWIEIFEPLTNEEAGKLIKHFFQYVNDKKPNAPDRLTELIFNGSIKPTLKRDLNSWQSERIKKSEAGKKGMAKRWDNNPITKITEDNTVMESITEITVKENVNVKDNVKDKVNNVLLKKEPKEREKINLNPFGEDFRPIWTVWIEFKKEQHKQTFKRIETEQLSFKHLTEISNNDPILASKIIEQSISNLWKGLFTLKNQNNGTVTKQTRMETFGAEFKRQFGGQDV